MAVRVLHVSMECVPFAKVGGMADVVGALPRALEGAGVTAEVLLPHYPRVDRGALGAEIAAFDVDVGGTAHPVRLVRSADRPWAVLVRQPTAFDRDGVYDDPATGAGYDDSLYRCLVLQQAARIAVRDGHLAADVVHCHDNHTGLLPAFLKDDGGPPSVMTIHNLAYQGRYGADRFALTGLQEDRFFGHSAFEFHGDLSLLKAGISFADAVTTVSPGYAEEITSPEFGCGLDGVLRLLGDRLVGILNGIDEDVWDPATDPLLPATYTAARPGGKSKCKEALRERAGLKKGGRGPLLGMVSRVTQQKGLDLVAPLLPWLARAGAQVVLLGTGDPAILDLYRGAAGRWPRQVALLEGYDEALAHLVYAGSDLFLMPSRFEPCGLSQMYAMRYGTVPVVTKVGGLKDTVAPFDETTGEGTGVLAHWATAESFHGAVEYGLDLYARRDLWRRVRRNGMERSFSWAESARAYADLYGQLVP